jgi:hypothetical protein
LDVELKAGHYVKDTWEGFGRPRVSAKSWRLAVSCAKRYTTPMADAAKDATGTLQGKTITLDEAVPALEGRRVHVVIEAVVEDRKLSNDENLKLWTEWVRRGEQGPIADDGEPEFP